MEFQFYMVEKNELDREDAPIHKITAIGNTVEVTVGYDKPTAEKQLESIYEEIKKNNCFEQNQLLITRRDFIVAVEKQNEFEKTSLVWLW